MKYKLGGNIVISVLEDEGIAFDAARYLGFHLNDTAAFILNCLKKEPLSKKQLAEKITAAYQVEEEEAFCDIEELMKNLKAYGMVEGEEENEKKEKIPKTQS